MIIVLTLNQKEEKPLKEEYSQSKTGPVARVSEHLLYFTIKINPVDNRIDGIFR